MRINQIDVGSRIRAQRKKRKLSLNQLASITGIAASNLSSIELNKSSPTLGTLAKIASAVDIKISALVEEIFYDKVILCLPEKMDTDGKGGKNVAQSILTRHLSQNSMEITSITLDTGAYFESEEGFERFIYCLDGQLTAQAGDDSYDIKKCSGLYLMPEIKAIIKNSSKSASMALVTSQISSK